MQEFSKTFIDLIHEKVKTYYHINLKQKNLYIKSPNINRASFKNKTANVSLSMLQNVNKDCIKSMNLSPKFEIISSSKLPKMNSSLNINIFQGLHISKSKAKKEKKVKSYFNLKSIGNQCNFNSDEFECSQNQISTITDSQNQIINLSESLSPNPQNLISRSWSKLNNLENNEEVIYTVGKEQIECTPNLFSKKSFSIDKSISNQKYSDMLLMNEFVASDKERNSCVNCEQISELKACEDNQQSIENSKSLRRTRKDRNYSSIRCLETSSKYLRQHAFIYNMLINLLKKLINN